MDEEKFPEENKPINDPAFAVQEANEGTKQTAIIVASVMTKALEPILEQLKPLASLGKFVEGTNIQEIMHAKAKSDFVAQAINAAIKDLGMDASRYNTYATELAFLVNKVYDKIQEKEKEKDKTDPELHNAENDYVKWKEKNG